MKTISLMMIAGLVATSLGGCIVHTHSSSRSQAVRTRECPPAYHWEGSACVHNGRARGHYK
jgi:hypothetical protein